MFVANRFRKEVVGLKYTEDTDRKSHNLILLAISSPTFLAKESWVLIFRLHYCKMPVYRLVITLRWGNPAKWLSKQHNNKLTCLLSALCLHVERQAGKPWIPIYSHWFDPTRNQTRLYSSRGRRSYHSAIWAVNIWPRFISLHSLRQNAAASLTSWERMSAAILSSFAYQFFKNTANLMTKFCLNGFVVTCQEVWTVTR